MNQILRLSRVNFLRLAPRMYMSNRTAGENKSNSDCIFNNLVLQYKNPNDESSFEKRRAALENEYFYKEQKRLLTRLREKLSQTRKHIGGALKRYGRGDDRSNKDTPDDDQKKNE